MQAEIIADMDTIANCTPDRFLKTCQVWIMGRWIATIDRRPQVHP